MSDIGFALPNCLPCCNSTANYLAVNCRTRGGTARLCGFAEYTSPSTPPKYYRQLDLDGLLQGQIFNDLVCGTLDCTATDTFSGTCTYDSSNCVLTTGGNRGRVVTGPDCGVTGPNPTCTVGAPSFDDTIALTQTTRTRTGGTACTAISGIQTFKRPSQTSVTETLSVEDLDSDAISRLIAISNYSAWTPVGDGSGGTCVVTQCCESNYQSRTSNVFTYIESQYRANIQDANTTSYSLMAELWRAPSGFANFALYSYQITPFTTNATGFASTIVGVPITQGYATYATNVDYF